MPIDPGTQAKITARLEMPTTIWLASVRSDGRPHLIPIWFVWYEGKIWIATGRSSQKHRNIQHDPRVCVALEDGNNPLVIEGSAAAYLDDATRDALAPHFVAKFSWDFRSDSDYSLLIGIAPERVVLGA